mmetsp:Transcript_19885/g.46247  ORF Transcript_19885/g.46247 Transcript_19885/m.46247 type:complete len:667 (-) Transcript_19885:243-2243(-)
MALRTLKFDRDGDLRRVQLKLPLASGAANSEEASATLAAVLAAARQTYGLDEKAAAAAGGDAVEKKTLALKYKDEEGDYCTLVEATMADFLTLAHSTGAPVKLSIHLEASKGPCEAAVAAPPGLPHPAEPGKPRQEGPWPHLQPLEEVVQQQQDAAAVAREAQIQQDAALAQALSMPGQLAPMEDMYGQLLHHHHHGWHSHHHHQHHPEGKGSWGASHHRWGNPWQPEQADWWSAGRKWGAWHQDDAKSEGSRSGGGCYGKGCVGPWKLLACLHGLQACDRLSPSAIASLAYQFLPILAQRAHRKQETLNRRGPELHASILPVLTCIAEQIDKVPEAVSLGPQLQSYIAKEDVDHLGDFAAQYLKALASSESKTAVAEVIRSIAETLVTLLPEMLPEMVSQGHSNGPEEQMWMHHGVACSACGATPLVGPRFQKVGTEKGRLTMESLLSFFEEHDPSLATEHAVEATLKKYAKDPSGVLQYLKKRYGDIPKVPEPAEGQEQDAGGGLDLCADCYIGHVIAEATMDPFKCHLGPPQVEDERADPAVADFKGWLKGKLKGKGKGKGKDFIRKLFAHHWQQHHPSWWETLPSDGSEWLRAQQAEAWSASARPAASASELQASDTPGGFVTASTSAGTASATATVAASVAAATNASSVAGSGPPSTNDWQ